MGGELIRKSRRVHPTFEAWSLLSCYPILWLSVWFPLLTLSSTFDLWVKFPSHHLISYLQLLPLQITTSRSLTDLSQINGPTAQMCRTDIRSFMILTINKECTAETVLMRDEEIVDSLQPRSAVWTSRSDVRRSSCWVSPPSCLTDDDKTWERTNPTSLNKQNISWGFLHKM